jgi:hypothetical protein
MSGPVGVMMTGATPAVLLAASPFGWLGEPRAAVLLVLVGVIAIGGGRRLLQAWRARRAVARLTEPDVTPGEIRALGEDGREGLLELFRLLESAPDAPLREAAGAALARLWERDQLVAEEEKAIVTRGYAVSWHARRRYPRGLSRPIPVVVRFGVPFLRPDGPGVRPEQVEWSYRVSGADRASLETDSPWQPGPVEVRVEVDRAEGTAGANRRLVLQARARTAGGLTSRWELPLPHVAFTFESNPRLEVDALLALPDAARADRFAAAVGLRDRPREAGAPPLFVPLGSSDLVLRDPPVLALRTPLPCDLAHRLAIEFEGLPGRMPAGTLVVSGQGLDLATGEIVHPLAPDPGAPAPIDRPGTYRLRAILTADPELGWADPDVRSVWPGEIATAWHEVALIRR